MDISGRSLEGNVLRLNADFVLHKICDLGAVSGWCGKLN